MTTKKSVLNMKQILKAFKKNNEDLDEEEYLEEYNGEFGKDYIGIEKVNLNYHINILTQNIPNKFKLQPQDNLNIPDNVLESALIYYRYTSIDDYDTILDQYINFSESIESLSIPKKSEKFMSIYNKGDILLIPGDSPTHFIYALKKKYPEIPSKNIIEFPISGINDYSDSKRLTISKEDLKDFDENKKHQNEVIDEYVKYLLKDKDKNSNFIYVDYIAGGRLLTQLTNTFKRLRFNNPIKVFRLKMHILNESSRCITSFKISQIEEFLKHLKEINFEYFKCNILLYIYGRYIDNCEDVNNTIISIENNYEIYSTSKIAKYIGKYINIEYVSTSEKFQGSSVKIISLKNIQLLDVELGELFFHNGSIILGFNNILSMEYTCCKSI